MPASVELQAGEFNDFEGDDGGWDVYAWKNFFYDSEEAEKEEVAAPAIGGDKVNEVLLESVHSGH